MHSSTDDRTNLPKRRSNIEEVTKLKTNTKVTLAEMYDYPEKIKNPSNRTLIPVRSANPPISSSIGKTGKKKVIHQIETPRKSIVPVKNVGSSHEWMGTSSEGDDDDNSPSIDRMYYQSDDDDDRKFRVAALATKKKIDEDDEEDDAAAGDDDDEEPQAPDENDSDEDTRPRYNSDDDDGDNNAREMHINVKQLTPSAAQKQYEMLCDRWLLPSEVRTLTDMERSIKLANNFKINLDDLRIEELDHSYESAKNDIESVTNTMHTHLLKTPGMSAETSIIMFNLTKVLKQCMSTYDFLVAIVASKNSMSKDEVSGDHIVRHKTLNANLDSKQQFLLYLYTKAAQRGYRKYGSKLYEPIYTKVGHHYTHSYRETIEIEDFVRNNCHPSLMEKHYLYITQQRRSTSQMIKDMTESLELLTHPHLPELKRDRHKFAFTNGILLTRVMVDKGKYGNKSVKTVKHAFYEYGSEEIRSVDQRLVAAKYFDLPFVNYSDDVDWYDIPTPALSFTLKYQFGDRDDYDEIARFMFMNIGRLCFNRNDLDNWQYMVHLIGLAGTGKSTIVEHLVKNIYEPANRAEIDNQIEKQFGLGGVYVDPHTRRARDIYVTTSAELANNCQLDTTLMLKIISGEEIQIAQKNKNPITARWLSHWISGENEFPAGWKDSAGQVMRRMLIFEYLRFVNDSDQKSDLQELIADEMPNIILKSIRAYHEYANQYGNYSPNPAGLKKFEPKYFKETRESLTNATNYLRAYVLESGRITLSPHLVVSEDDFNDDYRDYCRTRGVRCSMNSNKKVAFNTMIGQLKSSGHPAVEWGQRADFCYDGKQHWASQYYFFGIGLTSKLSDEEKERIYNQKKQQTADDDKLEMERLKEIQKIIGEDEEEIEINNDKGKEELYDDHKNSNGEEDEEHNDDGEEEQNDEREEEQNEEGQEEQNEE